MKEWFLPTLGAILCWGVWSFLPKISAQYIDATSGMIYQVLGGIIIAFFLFLNLNINLDTNPKGVVLGLLAGIINFLGVLFYLRAVSKGSVAIISTLSALYPLVVIFLSFVIFKETLTVKQVLGISFAFASITLMIT